MSERINPFDEVKKQIDITAKKINLNPDIS